MNFESIAIEFEGCTILIELDSQKYACRQMIFYENQLILNSCMHDCLAEGQVYKEELEGIVSNISSKEFKKKWSSSIHNFKANWEKTRINNVIGSQLQANFICPYYPYGDIFMLMNGSIGIMESNKKVYTWKDTNILVEVIGYDEIDMFVKIVVIE